MRISVEQGFSMITIGWLLVVLFASGLKCSKIQIKSLRDVSNEDSLVLRDFDRRFIPIKQQLSDYHTWDLQKLSYNLVQSCHTKEGYTCIFPFVYNGVMYNECTSDTSSKPWCPYKLKGDMTYDDVGINKWDYCTSSCTWSQRHPNLIKSWPTKSGFMCQFPFIHKEKLVYECTRNLEHEEKWCAYSTNNDKTMKDWDYCSTTWPETPIPNSLQVHPIFMQRQDSSYYEYRWINLHENCIDTLLKWKINPLKCAGGKLVFTCKLFVENENHKTVRYIADDEILGLENIYVLPTIKYLANKIFQCPKSTTVSDGYAIMCKSSFEKLMQTKPPGYY